AVHRHLGAERRMYGGGDIGLVGSGGLPGQCPVDRVQRVIRFEKEIAAQLDAGESAAVHVLVLQVVPTPAQCALREIGVTKASTSCRPDGDAARDVPRQCAAAA